MRGDLLTAGSGDWRLSQCVIQKFHFALQVLLGIGQTLRDQSHGVALVDKGIDHIGVKLCARPLGDFFDRVFVTESRFVHAFRSQRIINVGDRGDPQG